MATQACFWAELTIAEIRLIRQNGWQTFRDRRSLSIDRPESVAARLSGRSLLSHRMKYAFSILSGQVTMNELTVHVPASFRVDEVLPIRP